MKKIKYNKLTIQNFLSVGNDAVVIDFQNGLNLITGKNIDNPERNNGTGKSSVIEAFFYALFGETIRKIKQDFIINTETKGKGAIELSFDVEDSNGTLTYKVKRQIKPSKVELYVGDADITKDSIGNTNKFIQDLLGTNPVLCKSCDILSLSDNIPFMGKIAAEKRKFIEDIFSLEIFGKMSKDLKDRIKEVKSDLGISSTKIEEINNSIRTLTEQQSTFLKKIQEREVVLNARKSDLELKLNRMNSELECIVLKNVDELNDQKNTYSDLLVKIDNKINDINSNMSNNQADLAVKVKSLKKRESVGTGSCDKCLQDIPHSHIDILNAQKKELEAEIESINAEISKLSKDSATVKDKKSKVKVKLDEISNDITQQRLNQQKIKNLEDLIAECKESLEQIEKEFEEKVSSSNIFESSITETENRKEEELENFKTIKQKADDLDTCKFILSEEGIKSFVVKKLLKLLNSGIQKYITDLGMSMKCVFDEFFEEKMTNANGKEISYWNLSGGERRTVDLACAWAFKDLKRKISGVSSNLEFCDEIFDSAFDERGLDLLIDVLKDRIEAHKMSIYTISHRKETIKHIDGEIVYLEKENGITRRISD